VAVFADMLGYWTPPLDLRPTRDQAVDLLEVDVKDGLVFPQEDCFGAGSSFRAYS
jgi:hypothetical protein